jgi:hypothetical protein
MRMSEENSTIPSPAAKRSLTRSWTAMSMKGYCTADMNDLSVNYRHSGET